MFNKLDNTSFCHNFFAVLDWASCKPQFYLTMLFCFCKNNSTCPAQRFKRQKGADMQVFWGVQQQQRCVSESTWDGSGEGAHRCCLCSAPVSVKAVSDTLVCSLLISLWRCSTLERERGGVPWEPDRMGRGQHASQAFSHHEKKRNQIQAKSLSIYCIPHLSRAANWNQICRRNFTMGEGSTRGEM